MQSFLCWELRLPTSLPPAAAGSFAPNANFWLRAGSFHCSYVILCKPILRLAGVYGFPQAALSLSKFAHPW